MKKAVLKILIPAALSLAAAGAMADAISVEGRVIADTQAQVYAPIGGMVSEVRVKEGQAVREGDALLSLQTTKVYAEADGTIRGIFAQPGDAADTVKDRYGAVMYIETDSLYTISASTEYAYSSTETKTIHVGETVYLRASGNQKRTGVGRVTAVSGTKFTAEITEGEFITGEKAYVFRDADYTRTLKLGYGEVTRTAALAVNAQVSTQNSASGSTNTKSNQSIVRIAVTDGQKVKRGDLLMETLTGDFDGLYMSGADITAPCDGTVASLPYGQGTTLTKNTVAATLYTKESMCVSTEIPEENLRDLREGDEVSIALSTDETHRYPGVVRMVSGVASADTANGVTFTALIDFTPDEAVRYGSSVLVETVE
ncbi:MAG: HlyD family efflux transporter periplasmic adaptor subunit [Clostridia bacterium]|nr:HlyD family efflux transporter periplasmic adaptor subunit [Clostridia bacterium]